MLIQGGIFKLGEHEFSISPETLDKARIRKRSVEKMEFKTDGSKYT